MSFAQFLQAGRTDTNEQPQQPPEPTAVTVRAGSLRMATDAMEDSVITHDFVEQNLRGFYAATPTQRAQGCDHNATTLRSQGNTSGHGPFIMMVNVEARLHLAYGIARTPDDVRNQLNGNMRFRTHEFVVCLGQRNNDTELPTVCPIKPTQFFSQKRGVLGDFDTAAQIDPATIADEHPLQTPPAAQEQLFLPMVPLYGKDICKRAIDGIYGTDGTGPWKLKHLPSELNAYVSAVHDPTTKAELKKSIMGLITAPTQRRARVQVGTLALTKPRSVPPQIHQWITTHLNAVLNPTPTYQPPQPFAGPPPQTETGDPVVRFNLQGAGSPGSVPPASARPGDPATNRPGSVPPVGGLPGHGGHAPPNTNAAAAGWPGSVPPARNRPPSVHGTGWPGSVPPARDHTQPFPSPGGTGNDFGSQWRPIHLDQSTRDQIYAEDFHDAFFTHNRRPTTATLLHRPNATGVDAWSTLAKQKLMSFCHVQRLIDCPAPLLDLLEQPKTEQYSFFNVHILPILIRRDRTAFANFHFTAASILRICELNLTAADPSRPWHDGILGACMRRSADDLRSINQLVEARQETNIQINAAHVARINSRAPIVPHSMQELLHFLHRAHQLLDLLFPHSVMCLALRLVLDKLIDKGHFLALDRSASWLSMKPKETVFHLLQLERDEFTTVLPVEQIVDSTAQPNWFHHPDLRSIVNQCVQPGRTTDDTQLPHGLKITAPPPQPRPTDTRNGNPGPPTGPTNPGPADRQRTLRPPPGAGTNNNPRHHPDLRTFFASLPENRRNEQLARWLGAVRSSTAECLQELGLSPNDCGHFHLKGSCARPTCDRTHTPRDLPQAAVTSVCTRLRQGLDATA